MKAAETFGKWTYIVPISNLELTKTVNNEIRIDKVTFIDSKKLLYVRKRFGLSQTVGKLKRSKYKTFINRVLDGVKTYAIIRLTGQPKSLEEEAIRRIREELSILSLSQLGYSKRRFNSYPQISCENPLGRRSFLILNAENNSWVQSNQTLGKHGSLILDEQWKKFHKDLFFNRLLRILHKEIQLQESWYEDLRNAAVLAGQSQCTTDIPQAFLWNMIALELLLTENGDRCKDALPERSEAFLGWIGLWNEEEYEKRIREVYKKRCDFVHEGKSRMITLDDLFFTDTILLNLFLNIISHINIFKSKNDIISFSNKVEAEHILGIKPKVQPKTFRFLKPNYSSYDYEIIH